MTLSIVKQNLYSVKIATYKNRMARLSKENRAARSTRAPARRGARAASDRPTPRRRTNDTPYHHGDLHEALLRAAERVLERDGLAGLTLRAVAREAGVSHAAPTHHFGDLTGLLSELAAIGFRQFGQAMAAADASAATPPEKGVASAKAYVAYAQAHPGMYGLMFRSERLDHSRPSLHEASEASFAGLTRGVGASRHEQISKEQLTLDQAAAIASAWSLVHGFTMLMLDGRLKTILDRAPAGTSVEALLTAMLRLSAGRSARP
ncbi:TetR family transcriptional regulator [Bradyrhizobium sp. Ce-3]|nr:TetR family transcriptional regulator [Bradyrhizobium sp. Ce-3]